MFLIIDLVQQNITSCLILLFVKIVRVKTYKYGLFPQDMSVDKDQRRTDPPCNAIDRHIQKL